ncbi:MAG: hypothetical protein E6R03_15115 [Hyphomicrobiaceae bacterium]|nr:MAG: hypothetical protein E6R03_15115 [Hyphomicrobiaceae bacterium]
MSNAKANSGIQTAILKVGGQAALAAKLKVKQPAISYYLYKRCPAEKAIEIERLTGVPRAAIRPDLFQSTGKQKNVSKKDRPLRSHQKKKAA